MYKILFWITVILFVWQAYASYKQAKAAKQMTMYGVLLQAILIKHAGPKRAAKEIYYALSHNNDDVMPDYWNYIKKHYGIPKGESWHHNTEMVQARIEQDFEAASPRVDEMYKSWDEDDFDSE